MKQILLILITVFYSLNVTAKNKTIQEGMWRLNLELDAKNNLPCLLTYNAKSNQLIIKNGKENILLESFEIIGKKIIVKFPIFNSELHGEIKSKKLITGFWFNLQKNKDYKIPFTCEFNKKTRYDKAPINTEKFSGKWEVNFHYQKEKIEKAIGLFYFDNDLNSMNGTFLTETGDYRFLEGTSFDDSLYLSCFDGSHAFLFSAALRNDTLWGEFLSGKHYKTYWYAVKNESFELRNPDNITFVEKEIPLQFSLFDIDGKKYEYPNESLKNKVVLIQIMGSWCPNCLDETNYLKEVYQTNKSKLEIIAVTFETGKTEEEKINQLKKYQSHYGIQYPILLGGDACKDCAANLFPMVNEIISFPTLIFIDKKGEIRKIHTGFNGPGTGKIYDEFVKTNNEFIEALIGGE